MAKRKKKSARHSFWRDVLTDFLIGLLLLIIEKMIE